MNSTLKPKINQDISSDVQNELSKQVEAIVIPLLHKLKKTCTDESTETALFNALESNLQHVVNAYERGNSLADAYRLLTPVETLVASMVRQGLHTKAIATALDISAGTVSIHRKHIRKRLGLQRKGTNLQSYLQSLIGTNDKSNPVIPQQKSIK